MAWCFSTRPSVSTVLSVTSLYGLKMATEILHNQKEGYTSKIEILIFRINISEDVCLDPTDPGDFLIAAIHLQSVRCPLN